MYTPQRTWSGKGLVVIMIKFQVDNRIPGRIQRERVPQAIRLVLLFRGLRKAERNQKGKCVGFVLFFAYLVGSSRCACAIWVCFVSCSVNLRWSFLQHFYSLLCHWQFAKPLAVIINTLLCNCMQEVLCWILGIGLGQSKYGGADSHGHTLEPRDKVLVCACRVTRTRSSCSGPSGLVAAPLCFAPHYLQLVPGARSWMHGRIFILGSLQ